MRDTLHIMGISGSLRKESTNTGLLKAAAAMLPEGMTMEIADLSDIPLYNQDLEGPSLPATVREFTSKVAAADGLLIATPEYNYSVPGVLKNALDWASRPPKNAPLTGKPIALMGAGGAMGTVRAQLHLRQILLHNGTLVVPKPEVYVSKAFEKFDARGRLTHEPTRMRLKDLLEAFVAWIDRVSVPAD